MLIDSSLDNAMQVVSFSEARESFKAVLDRVEADAAHLQRWLEQAGRGELLSHGLIDPDLADTGD